ncbi:MAG: DUF1211 domain-containing protein [Anaerolineaceae bacterium]|nr:DUF1211 domain-containing protein [Anaerolineaceae bacterium]
MADQPHERDAGHERLTMFTDGVFAIAITLLALEIRIPELENKAELGQAIIGLLPQIFVFALAFMQVGILWLAHQRIFRNIVRTDSSFMWMSLIYLMFIAFLPVPSGTLARYGDEFPAVEFFAITLMLVGVVELVMWEYAASHHRLLDSSVTDLQIKETRWRVYYMIAVFGVSILIAFLSPLLAMFSWILLFFTRGLISRRFNRLSGNRPS